MIPGPIPTVGGELMGLAGPFAVVAGAFGSLPPAGGHGSTVYVGRSDANNSGVIALRRGAGQGSTRC